MRYIVGAVIKLQYLFPFADHERLNTLYPRKNGDDFPEKNMALIKTTFNAESQQKGPFSWDVCVETIQSLLEQYVSDAKSLSSIKEILLASNTLQRMGNEEEEKTPDHVAPQVPPPPLLHRPAKRFLEQSYVADTTPEAKRPRQENNSNYVEDYVSRSLSKEKTNFRDKMFEKTRSLGSTFKQLRPPPPLLKQEIDKNGQERRRPSPQDHYKFTKLGYIPDIEWNVSGDSRVCPKPPSPLEDTTRTSGLSQDSEQADTVKAKQHASYLSPESNPELLPRQIEGDCKSSCGGFAFDHTAMPKIVAVHSISKRAEDVDEWELNKAFISKVKAHKNRTTTRKEEETAHVQTKTVPKTAHESSFQETHGHKEADKSTVENDRTAAPGGVSFERYVLYHLLSKFQGNVEQVKRVLKQNLLQEWLSYCQGNVDPRQQTFNGVNFYELRKLYEIWCQLQKHPTPNEPEENNVQTIWNAQNLEPNCLQMGIDANSSKNQSCGLQNSQSTPNSQLFQASFSQPSQRNDPSLSRKVLQTTATSSRTPSNFQERVHSGVVGGTMIGNKQTESFFPRSSNYQSSPQTRTVNHFPTFNSNKLTLKSDTCQESSGRKRISRDQVQTDEFRPLQERITRNHFEASDRMHSQSKIVVQEQERADGTNISSVTLLHISKTNSKPSSLATTCQKSVCANLKGKFVQSQHNLKQAKDSELRSKNVVHGQETKGNYLWRFKGGKLISDSMPSINDEEPIPEVDLQNVTSGQQKSTEEKQSWSATKGTFSSGEESYQNVSAPTLRLQSNQSCQLQTSQINSRTLHQQHKKVCGAAASGKPCYCILEPMGGMQNAQTGINPIQCLQQLLKRADKSSSDTSRLTSLQGQSSKVKVHDHRSVLTTYAAEAKQKCYPGFTATSSAQGTQHADLQKQTTHPHAVLVNQQVHAQLDNVNQEGDNPPSQTTCLTNSIDTQASEQGYVIRKSFSETKTNEHSNASQESYSNAQLKQQSNADLNFSSGGQGYQQSHSIHKTYRNGQENQKFHSEMNASHATFHSSSNSPSIEASFSGLYNTSNKETIQQSSSPLKISSNVLGSQQSDAASQGSSVSSHIVRITQPRQKCSIVSDTQKKQLSSKSLHVSQTVDKNQQCNTSLKSLLNALVNQQSNANIRISPNGQKNEQSSPRFHSARNSQEDKQSNTGLKTFVSANSNSQSKASSTVLHVNNAQQSRQFNPSFCIPRTIQQPNEKSNATHSAQSNQKCTPSFHVLRKGQSFQQPALSVSHDTQGKQRSIFSTKVLPLRSNSDKYNTSSHISELLAQTVVRTVPKVDKTPTRTPQSTLLTNPIGQKTSKTKSKTPPVVIKSEKGTEKQRTFPASLVAKKQCTSLQQLAKKVIETRERYEMEKIPWKKKILKSLEGVLMKRLRKIERETGEKANLEGAENSATEVTISNKK